MQLIVTGRHVNVTEAMKSYAREKLARAMHERPHLNEVHLVMDVEKYRHRVEITARGKNLELFCKEETNDMYTSIDNAIAKLDRQLRKFKERHERKQTKAVPLPPSEPTEGTGDEGGLFVSSRSLMRPMFLNEALLQMKAERHLFLVFLNAETNEVNFLYRRGDTEVVFLAPKKIKGPSRAAQFDVKVFSEESIAPDSKPHCLRRESCEVDWSTPEDALTFMAANGYKYRFFMSTTAENASVVYRRADGGYALIEPNK